MAVEILSRLTGRTGHPGADPAAPPDAAGTPPPSGAEDPDTSGFARVAEDLKGTPKRGRGRPRGSKSKTRHRAQSTGPAGGAGPESGPAAGEREEILRRAEASRAADRFLESGIPRLVARIYSRGVDIAALVVLAGMHVPSNFYVRISADADAELWAEMAIRHSFEVAPERAEAIWRAVAMYGLPLLHVGEGVLAARDRYLAELAAARGPRP